MLKRVRDQWQLLIAIVVLTTFVTYTFLHKQPFLPPAANGYYWKPTFVDEFNGDALGPTRWVTCYDWYDTVYKGCTNSGNNELEWYKSSQVTVQDGYAELTAKPQPTLGWNGRYEQPYPYVSGMISTGRSNGHDTPKWSTLYGYYEARIKVSGGKGVWPAFWLLPINRKWPPEIDVMELVGHEPNQIRMTYHWPGTKNQPIKDETRFADKDFTKDWHVYSARWLPGEINWYIDGKLRKHVANEHVPNTPMELIINLAIGGTLPGDPDHATHFPATVQVDYVHVYQMAKQ